MYYLLNVLLRLLNTFYYNNNSKVAVFSNSSINIDAITYFLLTCAVAVNVTFGILFYFLIFLTTLRQYVSQRNSHRATN